MKTSEMNHFYLNSLLAYKYERDFFVRNVMQIRNILIEVITCYRAKYILTSDRAFFLISHEYFLSHAK